MYTYYTYTPYAYLYACLCWLWTWRLGLCFWLSTATTCSAAWSMVPVCYMRGATCVHATHLTQHATRKTLQTWPVDIFIEQHTDWEGLSREVAYLACLLVRPYLAYRRALPCLPYLSTRCINTVRDIAPYMHICICVYLHIHIYILRYTYLHIIIRTYIDIYII